MVAGVYLRALVFALAYADAGAEADWDEWAAWSADTCADTTVSGARTKVRTRTCVLKPQSDPAQADSGDSGTRIDSGCVNTKTNSGRSPVGEKETDASVENRCDEKIPLYVIIFGIVGAVVYVILNVAVLCFKNYYSKQKEKSRRLMMLEEMTVKQEQKLTALKAKPPPRKEERRPADKHQPAWMEHHFSTLQQLVYDKKQEKKQKLASGKVRWSLPRVLSGGYLRTMWSHRKRSSDKCTLESDEYTPSIDFQKPAGKHGGRRRPKISSSASPTDSNSLILPSKEMENCSKIKFDFETAYGDPAVTGPHRPPHHDCRPGASILRTRKRANDGSPRVKDRNRHFYRRRSDRRPDVNQSQSLTPKRRPEKVRPMDDSPSQSPQKRHRVPTNKRRPLLLSQTEVDRRANDDPDNPFGFYRD